MSFGNPIVGSADALIRNAIRSRNYVPGVAGWSINKDGFAEFNNIAINGGELLIINPATGEAVASINNQGTGSFEDVTVVQSPTFYGLDLQTQIVGPLAKGLIAYGHDTTLSVSSTTERGLIEVACVIEADRAIFVEGAFGGFSNAADTTVTINLRYTTNGTKPLLTSPSLGLELGQFAKANAGGTVKYFRTYGDGLPPGNYRFLLTGVGDLGANITYVANTALPLQLSIYDMGSAKPNTGVLNSGTGGGTNPVQQYTVDHLPIWSRSYKGDGTPGSFANATSIYQGNSGDANGNRKSMIGFDWASIQSGLSGATIDACYITLYYQHWYYNAGGTAVIGTHNSSSATAPGTWSGTPAVFSTGWPKPGQRTVDLGVGIGQAFRDGTAKGITIGPGASPVPDNLVYYGYAAGVGASPVPRLTFVYTK